jgi:hypothetical protein
LQAARKGRHIYEYYLKHECRFGESRLQSFVSKLLMIISVTKDRKLPKDGNNWKNELHN